MVVGQLIDLQLNNRPAIGFTRPISCDEPEVSRVIRETLISAVACSAVPSRLRLLALINCRGAAKEVQ